MIFEKQVVNGYKGMMHTRYDNVSLSFYFSHKDFDGFQREAYAFKSSMGHTLQGYLYYYDQFREDRLIVFDHGLGNGHRAYMKEIEKLCSHGYRVFAYDHTGCMESGGESTNGLAQSLCDLNDCLATIKADKRFTGIDISVVGHSWGGFATLCSPALSDKITHIVAIAGFISVKDILSQFMPGPLKLYVPAMLRQEERNTPGYSAMNAKDVLSSSSVKAMIIHSEDDPTVKYKKHFAKLEKALKDRPNTHFVSVTGKGHNPNYTGSAVMHKDAFFAELEDRRRSGYFTDDDAAAKFRAEFDFEKMTEQDEEIFAKIFEFLKS